MAVSLVSDGMGGLLSLVAVAAAAFFAGYQRAATVYTRMYCDRLHVLIDKVEAFMDKTAGEALRGAKEGG